MNSITVAPLAQRKTAQPLKHSTALVSQMQFNDPEKTMPSMTTHEFLRSLSATELQQLRKSIQRELFMLSYMPKIIILAVLSVFLFFLVFV